MICFHCGGSYRWVFQNRKWHALNLGDNANHWSTCPGRRKKAHPAPEVSKGRRIVGPNYSPSCGKCDVPPWEACACSFNAPSAADQLNAEADNRLQLALGDA